MFFFSFGVKVKIRHLDLSILKITIYCTEANAFVFSQSIFPDFKDNYILVYFLPFFPWLYFAVGCSSAWDKYQPFCA